MLEFDLIPKLAAQGKVYAHFNKKPWFTTNSKEQWEYTKKHWKLPD